ncbi:acyl-CoA dehydrogenase [Intrasporangium chromatireducens Q5-1]|uniref:Acyl-CoA dehydrogenase n=1 Tax=Intrasporangium chromatireducens Q5-1 TaxID=584657 RepID=W9GTU1_9MICO|nr:acyl-CoA dehydrogenase family protein [Intrasporangium chromatireducens]EWT07304.1 acyl-CoA dehydrogenase [Intrasporangium chromatireducens Q5-1]
MTVAALSIDTDPTAYEALQKAVDEPVADGALTDREREVRAIARGIAARELAPRAAAIDAEHAFALEGVGALNEAGLGGLLFPERLGGTGDSNVAYALAMEEITAACAATSLIFMTQMHAAYPILLCGNEEQQRRYIPGLIQGTAFGSIGVTEPDAGSDVASLRTTATPTEHGWSLSGQKTFITTGDRADVIICFATVDRDLGRKGVTAFIVEGNWEGVQRGKPFHKMGMNGSSTAELFFDQVAVPRENLLGEERGGWPVVMSSVVKTRLSAAAQGVGLARGAYARTLAFLTDRYGKRIPEEHTFALAELRGRLLQGRLLLHAVARQADRDPHISPGSVGIMKQSCTDLGFMAAVEATRILGPHGDLAALGVERFLRDAKVTQIYDGTNEIQRLLIGRETTRALEALS